MRGSAFTYRNLFAALTTGCFFLSACENKQEDVDALTRKRVLKEEAYQVESYLSQEARVKARLTAPLMIRYQTDTPMVEFTKSLHVDFLDDSLATESILDARYARYMENSNLVYLKDSVVLINKKTGDTLRSDDLYWDQNNEMIYTATPVQIRTRTRTLNGVGMRSKQNLRDYSINKLNGMVKVAGAEFPQ